MSLDKLLLDYDVAVRADERNPDRYTAADVREAHAAVVSFFSDGRWVSVTERTPKRGKAVIAFWTPDGGKVTANCFGVAVRGERGWHDPEDDDNEYCDPSHWMPLPEAPK